MCVFFEHFNLSNQVQIQDSPVSGNNPPRVFTNNLIRLGRPIFFCVYQPLFWQEWDIITPICTNNVCDSYTSPNIPVSNLRNMHHVLQIEICLDHTFPAESMDILSA